MSKEIFVLFDDKKRPGNFPRTVYAQDLPQFKKLNNDGFGVFFAVNEFDISDPDFAAYQQKIRAEGGKPGNTKRQNVLVTRIRYAYGDLDIAKEGGSLTREQKQEKKLIVLQALEKKCQPTRIIDTSNGLQPLWQLEPFEITPESTLLYTKVLKGIVQWSKQYGCSGDNVYDVARVLRVPGFYHQKEEPYLCSFVHESKQTFVLEALAEIFPFTEENPAIVSPKTNEGLFSKTHKLSNNYTLSEVDKAINAIDFRELVIRTYAARGVKAEFDYQGRVIEDGRQTGTFQGRQGDGQYLASTSHDPHRGNRITLVKDILQLSSNSEARKWIISQYGLSETKLTLQNKPVEPVVLAPITPLLPGYYDSLFSGERRYIGTPSGFTKFDNATSGLQGLMVIGGIAGTGKTSFALQVAYGIALAKMPVLIYSLEMSKSSILTRLLSQHSKITYETILLKGKPLLTTGESSPLTPSEGIGLFEAKKKIEEVADRFYLVDSNDGMPTVEKLKAQIEFLQEKFQKKEIFVVIDHLQIFPVDGAENLKEKIDMLMESFLRIQRATGACILLISQKNRAGYYSTGMEAFMGSASIEYQCDIAMLLESELEKKSRKKKKDDESDDLFLPGAQVTQEIDLVIKKNRINGPQVVKLVFDGAHSFFTEK